MDFCATAMRVRAPVIGMAWRRVLPWLAFLMGLICEVWSVMPQEVSPSESQVKAAFLINFPKYVEWPAEAFADTNSPFVLVVLGNTEVLKPLRQMIQTRAVNGRPFVLKLANTEQECAGEVHILFIPDAEKKRTVAALEKLKERSVLTVGESDDFVEEGGVINLARRDRKVRLDVNLNSARQVRLKVNSKLLAVADRVIGKEN